MWLTLKKYFFQRTNKARQLTAILIVIIVAGIGSYLLISSHAASPYASITAESGNLAGAATKHTCSGASDGNCVQFGSTPGSGATINPTPDGVPVPSGGWSVDYADAFNEPLCQTSSQPSCDNTLFPSRSSSCNNTPGYNTDEMEVFNCSAVSESPSSGLSLSCKYTPGLPTASGYVASNYTCGAVNGAGLPAGYKPFAMMPGEGNGQEWAVETVAQFPPNTGEADPGWWAHGGNFQEELDFFEGFGAGAGKGGTWTTSQPPSNGYVGGTDPTWIYNEGLSSQGQIYGDNAFFADYGFDPSAAFHTYTTVFFPDGSFSHYVDGRLRTWSYVPTSSPDCAAGSTTCTVMGPPPVNNNQAVSLTLSYGLRSNTDGDPDPYFTSGTRNFNIRSIAVYENTASNGANASNSGLAPGTTVN